MIEKIMTIKKLIKGGIIIVLGTLVGSIANYLYNTMTGRLLGPSNYGSFTSLLSLLALVSVPTLAIQTVAAKFSSRYLAEKNYNKTKTLVTVLHQRLWIIGLGVTLILIIFSRPISNYLNITSVIPLIILSLAFLVAFLVPITRGLMQGMQSFFQLSVNTSMDAVFRLGIGLGLIAAGLALNGAIAGVVSGMVLAYIFSFLPIRKIFGHDRAGIDKKQILNYSWPTLITILCLTALVNVDIILAKHYLTPIEAGHYAALSTIAKIIFYFSGPIVSVMFPMISDLYAKGERHFHILITTILGVFGASLLILVFFTIAPKFTINILYGAKFIDIWYQLPSMGIVMLIYGLSNVMVNYFLSINQMKFVWYLIFFTILEVIGLLAYHGSVANFILVLLVTQVLLLLTLFGIYVISKWKVILNWKQEK